MFNSKFIKMSIITSFLCIMCAFNAFALDAKITFSDPSANVGGEVDVVVKITAVSGGGLGQADVMLKYDSTKLDFIGGDNANGGAGSIKLGSKDMGKEQWAYNLKFKALAAGETNVEVTTWEIYDTDSKIANLSQKGHSVVKISGDNNTNISLKLKELNISPGTLEPAFSPDIKDYKVTLPSDVSNLVVSAKAENDADKYTVSGNEGLAEGSNNVVVTVTSADSSSSVKYNINVIKGEAATENQDDKKDPNAITEFSMETQEVDLGGVKYQIANMFDISIMPEGYAQTSVDYNGKAVMACENADNGITLVYLIAEDGSGDFYLYDRQTGNISSYAALIVGERILSVVDKPENVKVPEGLKESKIKISEKEVVGWIEEGNDNPESCIVYAVNSVGEAGFYRYDIKEKTLQRYFDGGIDKLKARNKELSNKLLVFMITSGVACLALIGALVLLLKRKKGSDNYRDDREFNYKSDKKVFETPSKETEELNFDDVDDIDSESDYDEFEFDFEDKSNKEEYVSQKEVEQQLTDNVKNIKKEEYHNEDDDFDDFEIVDI